VENLLKFVLYTELTKSLKKLKKYVYLAMKNKKGID
tara:strand:+ start:1826 stop:1933 length:108 start_codon:yes stop_codon:yes gene_type:complete